MLSNEHYLQHFDHAHKPRDVTTSHIMRGLTPHNASFADRKPSKLDLMRADYQKKLLKEKEDKLVQIYEDNQRKVMKRVTGNGSGNVHTGEGYMNSQRTVWKSGNERQRMETNSAPSTDYHYEQTRDLSTPKDWPGRGDSGGVLKMQKSSAGRDRSQPLAPIRRPPDTQDGVHAARSGIPQKLPVAPAGHGDGNPFHRRARLVKHKPLPPSDNRMIVDNHSHGDAGDPKAMVAPLNGQRLISGKSPQTFNHLSTTIDKPLNDTKGERSQSRTHEKLTDYQKWQVEQSQARDERLKKLNVAMALSNNNNGVWKLPEEDDSTEDNDNLKASNESGEDENIATSQENDIKVKEKELMEKISNRQRELERIKKERAEQDEQDEQEQLEQERQNKKDMAERMKQTKLAEEKKKEEAKRLKQEENEMRKEEKKRKDKEKGNKEDEKRRKEEDKRRQENEKHLINSHRDERNKSTNHLDKMSPQSVNSRNNRTTLDDNSSPLSVKPSASGPKMSRNPHASKSKMDSGDPDERRLSLSDAHVYEQAAASYAAQVSVGDLSKCQLCGRSFLKDRLRKHQDACAKANKPRKEFDSAKKRVEGTELAKYAGKAKRPEPPKKKSNWRAKHEEFIQNLRHAKKVTKCEKEGGDLRKITPPPATRNPDYVACPHCGRTFNESAAERHIPRCQSLKTRPPPMNTRRK
uniref:C2HC/C3H-type domain-containing protein n=1 Tax=Arion vulgaris TaxID=1028688 RepID=A0A0B6YW12_9EUPU